MKTIKQIVVVLFNFGINLLFKYPLLVLSAAAVFVAAVGIGAFLIIGSITGGGEAEAGGHKTPGSGEADVIKPDTDNIINDVVEYNGSPLVYEPRGEGLCIVVGYYDIPGDGHLYIPKYAPSGERVIGIANSAFDGCEELKYISLPDSLEFIDSYAFHGCCSLSGIYYQGSVDQWNEIIKYSEGNSAVASVVEKDRIYYNDPIAGSPGK